MVTTVLYDGSTTGTRCSPPSVSKSRFVENLRRSRTVTPSWPKIFFKISSRHPGAPADVLAHRHSHARLGGADDGHLQRGVWHSAAAAAVCRIRSARHAGTDGDEQSAGAGRWVQLSRELPRLEAVEQDDPLDGDVLGGGRSSATRVQPTSFGSAASRRASSTFSARLRSRGANSPRKRTNRLARARSSSAMASGRTGLEPGPTCCRRRSRSVACRGPLWALRPVASTFRTARLWMPVRNNDEQCGRGCVYLNGIGRLANGATVEAAQGEMTAVASALERDFHGDNANVTVMVQSLHDRTVGSVQLALVVLLAAVTMVLLIACANVANLLLVRGAARHSEIAVRTALGAGRRGIVSYLLTENLVLAIVGGVFGLLLAVWGIEVLTALAPANLPRLDDVRFDAPTFAFALTIVLATTVIFGLGPSLSLSRVSLSRALGQRGSVGTNRPRWTRSTLLVSEVALSLILLLGAGLLLRSLSALQKTDMGLIRLTRRSSPSRCRLRAIRPRKSSPHTNASMNSRPRYLAS